MGHGQGQQELQKHWQHIRAEHVLLHIMVQEPLGRCIGMSSFGPSQEQVELAMQRRMEAMHSVATLRLKVEEIGQRNMTLKEKGKKTKEDKHKQRRDWPKLLGGRIKGRSATLISNMMKPIEIKPNDERGATRRGCARERMNEPITRCKAIQTQQIPIQKKEQQPDISKSEEYMSKLMDIYPKK